MKKAVKISIFSLATIIFTGLLTRLWLTKPDLFPAFPKFAAEYLVKLYGAQNAEEVANLELLLGLSLSLAIVLTSLLIMVFIWLRIKKAHESSNH